MSRALDHVLRTPWAITQDALEMVASIAARENRPIEVIERELGRDLRDTESVRIRDGVAIIPVSGPLFRYGNLFTRVSGATSLELLSVEFEKALASPAVSSIVLAIDSPGGQVNGVDDLAELIHRARGRKPISAHISGAGASGAYWLASAADEVSVSATGMVGSIGAIMSITDYSKQDDARGKQTVTFVSSVSPRKNLDHRTEEGTADIQSVVDAIGLTFVQAVANHRGISVEEVLERYGQGAVFVGSAAVEAGLADRVELLEDVIARLAQGQRSTLASARSGDPGANSNSERKGIMKDELTAEAEVLTAAQLEERHPEAATAIRTASAAEGMEQGYVEGRKAALEILALHAPGLDELRAELAADASITPDIAARRLNAAQAERDRAKGDAFIKARQDDESQTSQPTASSEDGMGDADRLVARILATEAQVAPGGA